MPGQDNSSGSGWAKLPSEVEINTAFRIDNVPQTQAEKDAFARATAHHPDSNPRQQQQNGQ
jgi:hypothetical protein